ncbi:MAG: glycerol-3-phosphate 1-O-acyltransferase PlsY [Chloroflexi bacterium]|nr:glycerol-3-phosphate 1-O-acyltransferase PlsY [Chloroflexota bacterium]
MWEYPVVALVSYLVGGIPTGYILGRILKGVDIRAYGSGATGATNVLRTLGTKAFLFVLVTDVLKGFVPVLVVWQLTESHNLQVTSGLCALAGHDFPVYIGFRGGRGVATAFGVYAGMVMPLFFGLVALGLFIVLAFRYMSLMSIVTVPLGMLILLGLAVGGVTPYVFVAFGGLASALIWARHTGNIQRLIRGTEPKLGEGGERHIVPGTR